MGLGQEGSLGMLAKEAERAQDDLIFVQSNGFMLQD
jgi:hypothetical protein